MTRPPPSPPPRDWDKELAQIDKLIASQPAPVPAPPVPGRVPPPAGSGVPSRSRDRTWATWLRVLLGVLLAAAMTQWPYGHSCGLRLFVFLGAVGVVSVAGLWGALSSWRRRMGLAHTVSLLVLGWGLALAAGAVLPRIGYARTALPWLCP